MTSRRPVLAARAFTLIEILVSMLIFSVLIGALYSVLFSAIRLRETTFRNVESGMPRDQIAAIIRSDIENIVAPGGTLAGPLFGQAQPGGSSSASSGSGSGIASLNLGTLNVGGTSSTGQSSTPTAVGLGNPADDYLLTFYTTGGSLHDNDPWGDIQEVQYSLVEPANSTNSNDGLDLVRTVTRNLISQDPALTSGTSADTTGGTTTNNFTQRNSALGGNNSLNGVTDETQVITETHLLGNIASLQILYWDSVNEEWTDTWDTASVAQTLADAAASGTDTTTAASTTSTSTDAAAAAAANNVNPTAIDIIIDFVNSDPNAHFEKPLDLVIPIHTQPRPTPDPAAAGGGAGGGGGGAGG